MHPNMDNRNSFSSKLVWNCSHCAYLHFIGIPLLNIFCGRHIFIWSSIESSGKGECEYLTRMAVNCSLVKNMNEHFCGNNTIIQTKWLQLPLLCFTYRSYRIGKSLQRIKQNSNILHLGVKQFTYQFAAITSIQGDGKENEKGLGINVQKKMSKKPNFLTCRLTTYCCLHSFTYLIQLTFVEGQHGVYQHKWRFAFLKLHILTKR